MPKNENRIPTLELAITDYDNLLYQIEEELFQIIFSGNDDDSTLVSNLFELSRVTEKVLKNKLPGTSQDRIYWFIRQAVFKQLIGEDEAELIKTPDYLDERVIDKYGGESDYVIAMLSDTGQPLAVKLMRENMTAEERVGFQHEQEILARLGEIYQERYPLNLLKIFALGIGVTATERIVGGVNLFEKMHKQPDLKTVEGWIKDICDGLHSLYQAGYCRHGDIKPANCIQGADGIVRVGDFSLVDSQPRAFDQSSQLGTYQYMAPELKIDYMPGAPIINQRADVYSLGIMLFQFLTNGRDPYFRHRMSRAEIQTYGKDIVALVSYCQTAVLSGYAFTLKTLNNIKLSNEEINAFAKQYRLRSLSGLCNSIDDNAIISKLDVFISDCLSFDLRRRPSNPSDFFARFSDIIHSA